MQFDAWWWAIILPFFAMSLLLRRRRRAYLRQRPNQLARARREYMRDARLTFWAGEKAAHDPVIWNTALSDDARYIGWWIITYAPACALCIGVGLYWNALVGSHLTQWPGPLTWLALEAITLVLIAAGALAYVVATHKARDGRVAPPGFEPERRGIADYVSPLFWPLWLAVSALTLVAYLATERQAPAVPMTVMGVAHAWSPLEIAEASLLASLFTLLAAAFAAQWIVTTPAVAGIADGLMVALNDAHRAQAIGHLTWIPFEINLITLLFLTPGVVSNGWVILLLVAPLVAPVFIRIRATECRLGGRLTGWWWDLRPSPYARRTVEGG